MERHPKVSYREALSLLIREEETERREAGKEFDRRTEVYRSEFGFLKVYKDAQKMVAETDPERAAVYRADETPSSLGEVVAAGKRAASAAKISMSDAVMRILKGQRSRSQRIAGDWLSHRAMTEINNQNLGSSIDRAYSIALRIVRNTFPEVTAMADFGTVSETAMRIVFIGWFKD